VEQLNRCLSLADSKAKEIICDPDPRQSYFGRQARRSILRDRPDAPDFL
jgi:hypothetical protein